MISNSQNSNLANKNLLLEFAQSSEIISNDQLVISRR